MPRNGSGVYSKPAGTTAVPNTVIESAKYNSTIDDIAQDLNTARPIVAGGTGATSVAAAQTGLSVDNKVVYAAKSADYTAIATDNNGYFRFTATATLNLTAAATLAANWHCVVQANGGVVTIDPNGAETINGAATLALADGQSALIVCTGTAFFAVHCPGLNSANVWSGANTFSGVVSVTGSLEVRNTAARFDLHDTDSSIGIRVKSFIQDANTFSIQTRDNTGSFVANDLIVTTAGTGSSQWDFRIAGSNMMYIVPDGVRSAADMSAAAYGGVSPNFASSTTAGYYLASGGAASFSRSANASLFLQRTTSDGTIAAFIRQTTTVGTISVTAAATTYNTSSDYRLKTIDGPLTGSGAFIDALKPCKGSWNIDGSPFVGFLAHEFQKVSPSSVTGEKDAVDEDGNPIYQAMQPSSSEVMANIIAEMQSLRNRLKALEDAA